MERIFILLLAPSSRMKRDESSISPIDVTYTPGSRSIASSKKVYVMHGLLTGNYVEATSEEK